MIISLSIRLLLVALLVAASAELDRRGLMVSTVSGLLLLLTNFVRIRIREYSISPAIILGVCTPLLPVLGGSELLVVALLYLLLFTKPATHRDLSWALPFLAVVMAWGFVLLWVELKSLLDFGVPTIMASGSLESFRVMLGIQPEVVGAVRGVALFVMIVLLFSHLRQDEQAKRQLLVGISFGLGLSLIVLVLQFFGIEAAAFPQFTSFWRAQNRYPSSFSDPNAYGIVALISLPVWWQLIKNGKTREERVRLGAYAVVFLLVALLSGSRTYLLGVAITILLLLMRARPRFCGASIVFGILLLGLLNLAPELAPQQFSRGLNSLPGGPQRIVSSLLLTNISETFQSRRVFFELTTKLWIERPANSWFGVGFGRYPSLFQDLAARNDYFLGDWVDNANNFYFGVLAELGLVGFLALIVSLLSLRPRADGCGFSKATLAAFLVVLMLGPHIYFVEVAIVVALLLSLSVEPRPILTPWISMGLLVGVFACAVAALESYSLGLYPWERRGDGFARWSAPRASLVLDCGAQSERSLDIRAVFPDPSPKEQLKIQYLISGERREIALKHGERGTISGLCEAGELKVKVGASHGWSPASFGSRDKRVLGFEISGEPGITR